MYAALFSVGGNGDIRETQEDLVSCAACGDFSEEVISDLLSEWLQSGQSVLRVASISWCFYAIETLPKPLVVTNENYGQYRRVDRSGGGMPVHGNIVAVRADVLDGGNQARNFRLQSRDESGN